MTAARRTDVVAHRSAVLRTRVLRHFQEGARNVSASWRHFRIHRNHVYDWRRRRAERGDSGLFDARRGRR